MRLKRSQNSRLKIRPVLTNSVNPSGFYPSTTAMHPPSTPLYSPYIYPSHGRWREWANIGSFISSCLPTTQRGHWKLSSCYSTGIQTCWIPSISLDIERRSYIKIHISEYCMSIIYYVIYEDIILTTVPFCSSSFWSTLQLLVGEQSPQNTNENPLRWTP